MNKTFSSLLATAGLAFGLTLTNSNQLQAATITYDLSVTIDSGSLLDQTYTGSFSFSDSVLTGVGDEFLPVTNLEFNFLATEYTETDDSFNAEAAFFDGEFLGLSYSTDVEFSFVPGFFALDESFFAYDLGDDSGTGDIVYSVRSEDPNLTTTAEPATMIGLLTTVILGNSLRQSKFSRQQDN